MKWLTDTEAAEYLGVSPNTLRCWRSQRRGPRYYKTSKRMVRYLAEDLDAWMVENNQAPEPIGWGGAA